LFAGKGEQALGQIGAPRRSFLDHLGIDRELRPCRDAFDENFDSPDDDRENVVQVVSDASGQLSDRFHLLGLTQLQIDGVLFAQQNVFFLDQQLHVFEGHLQLFRPGGGCDRLREDVGETGKKINVVLVVIVLVVAVDLENPIRPVIAALDDDIDNGNHAMCGIKRRQIEIGIVFQVVTYRRFAGRKSAPLR
jgi:hypothetical protein